MREVKNKKYPLIKYLCWLLVVAFLFTGVTFSRYSVTESVNTETGIGVFNASYEITDMSSATFSNVNYWLNLNGGKTAMNSASTLRFTLRNHSVLENGIADRISDVDLQASLRFYAPAEFAGNLAVQIAEVDDTGGYIVRTPQYVLKDLIYTADNNFKTWNGEVFNTSSSEDYDARTDADGLETDEELTVNGGFTGTAESHVGVISAYSHDSGNRLSITSSMSEAAYSVGFYRHDAKNQNISAPIFYLDCKETVPFYTVELSLPEMLLKSGITPQTRTFVVFITLLKHIKFANDENDSAVRDETLWDAIMKYPASGTVYFNDAEVTGYHFDRKADIFVMENGSLVKSGEQTLVRIKKSFENGTANMSYMHVAPLTEGAASLVHPIEDFFDVNGSPVQVLFGDVTGVHGYFGKCVNNGGSGYISFKDFQSNPYYGSYASQVAGGEHDYKLDQIMSKGYAAKINALFVQVSD